MVVNGGTTIGFKFTRDSRETGKEWGRGHGGIWHYCQIVPRNYFT